MTNILACTTNLVIAYAKTSVLDIYMLNLKYMYAG